MLRSDSWLGVELARTMPDGEADQLSYVWGGELKFGEGKVVEGGVVPFVSGARQNTGIGHTKRQR